MRKFQVIERKTTMEKPKVLGTYNTMTEAQDARLEFEMSGEYNAKFLSLREVWQKINGKKYEIWYSKPDGCTSKKLFVSKRKDEAEKKMNELQFDYNSKWLSIVEVDDVVYETYVSKERQKRLEELEKTRMKEVSLGEGVASLIALLAALVIIICYGGKK